MITWIINVFNTRIYQYLAITFTIVAAYFSIRRGGRLAERSKNLEINSHAMEKRNEVENAAGTLSDADINKRLREKYSRD